MGPSNVKRDDLQKKIVEITFCAIMKWLCAFLAEEVIEKEVVLGELQMGPSHTCLRRPGG